MLPEIGGGIRMIDESDVVDARKAGELLGLHEVTVRRLARENKIPAFKVGGVWRFNRTSIHLWAESQVSQPNLKTVLIVDDDELVRDSLGRIIERAGYRVVTARGGADALVLMQAELPDLLLLDLKMPDMDGPTTLRHIRESFGFIPVIIVTGYPESDLMTKTLECSPVTLVAKPVVASQLLQAVRMVLEESAVARKAE